MEYKIARIENIDEIIKMKNEVKQRVIKERLPIWMNGYPLDEMIISDVENNEGRIVTIGNEIVAYACFHHRDTEYDVGTFKKDNIYCFGRVMVKDGYTRMHIGDYLIGNMIEEAKKMEIDGVGILADSCNEKAINLYQKHGFVKEGERQFPYAYLDIFGLYF